MVLLKCRAHLSHRSLCCCVAINTAQPTLIWSRVCWKVCVEAHAAVLGENLSTSGDVLISPFSVTHQTTTTRAPASGTALRASQLPAQAPICLADVRLRWRTQCFPKSYGGRGPDQNLVSCPKILLSTLFIGNHTIVLLLLGLFFCFGLFQRQYFSV